MTMQTTRKTTVQIVREVADEWAELGKMTVPPDAPGIDEDDVEFWAEVQRRLDAREELS